MRFKMKYRIEVMFPRQSRKDQTLMSSCLPLTEQQQQQQHWRCLLLLPHTLREVAAHFDAFSSTVSLRDRFTSRPWPPRLQRSVTTAPTCSGTSTTN